MRIVTSTFQIWAILAAVTAGFSLINMILISNWLKGPKVLQRLQSSKSELFDVHIFTAIVFAATFISGTISAIMIFIKPDAPYIGTFVDVAKATILAGITIQLQTAISIGTNNVTATAVLTMSIIYLIVEIAGLVALCYLSIKSETANSNV